MPLSKLVARRGHALINAARFSHGNWTGVLAWPIGTELLILVPRIIAISHLDCPRAKSLCGIHGRDATKRHVAEKERGDTRIE